MHETTYVPAKQLILISITYWDLRSLRWIVELGRVDICLEVSMMSSHLALPLGNVCFTCSHIWVSITMPRCFVWSYTEPQINSEAFKKQDWTYCTMSEMDRTRTEVCLLICLNRKREEAICHSLLCVDADHMLGMMSRGSLALDSLSTWILLQLQSFGIPRDREAKKVRHTRLSFSWWRKLLNTFVHWDRLRMMGIRVEGQHISLGIIRVCLLLLLLLLPRPMRLVLLDYYYLY